MAKYRATVCRMLEIEFDFTDEDIEDVDSPEDAAAELALNEPTSWWDEVYSDVTVDKIED